jgi:hypothetical protein
MDDQRTDREGGGIRRRQLSIKRLLLSVTLIAAGLAMSSGFIRDSPRSILAFFACGALIAAGFFTPFRRTWLGILIGLAIPTLFLAAVIASLYFNGLPVD